MSRRVAPSIEMPTLWMDKGQGSLPGILAGRRRIRLRMMTTTVVRKACMRERTLRLRKGRGSSGRLSCTVNLLLLLTSWDLTAVPKRILDLMNVEGITRENVASHLQKYRLYLKRLSVVARQQASMVAALGGSDLPYLPMYSVDGLGDFQGLAASDYTPALSSYPQNGVLSLTIPTTLGMQGLSRSGMVHFGESHDTTDPTMINLHKLQYSSSPGNLLHRRPMPFELENFRQQKTMPVNSRLPITLSRGPDSSMSMMRAYACPIASKNSLNSSIVPPQHDPDIVRDGQCQVNSADTKFVNIRSTCNSRQKWEEQKGSHASEPSLLSGSLLNRPLSKHPLLDPLAEKKRLNIGLCRIISVLPCLHKVSRLINQLVIVI